MSTQANSSNGPTYTDDEYERYAQSVKDGGDTPIPDHFTE